MYPSDFRNPENLNQSIELHLLNKAAILFSPTKTRYIQLKSSGLVKMGSTLYTDGRDLSSIPSSALRMLIQL